MGALYSIFTFPSLTIAATLESLLVVRLLSEYFQNLSPNHSDTENSFCLVAIIFLANYAFGILFWGLLYPKFLSPLRNISGPRSFMSIAHRSLLVTERPPGDLFLDLIEEYPGEEILVLNASEKQVLITKPRMLADLLVHKAYDFVKPQKISGFLRHILGDGLIVVEGDQHKFLRKNTMPAFSFRHIKNLYPMMWTKAVLMTTSIRNEVIQSDSVRRKSSGVIELSTWASRATLDIIGVAGLGREFHMLKSSDDPLLDVYEQLLEPSPEKILFAVSAFAFGIPFVQMLPWKMNGLFKYLTSCLSKICLPMMQEKKELITKSGDSHFDILSLLIKSNNFTDNELKDQLLTFLAAGHETTSSAFTWACYLLAKNQDLQEKLRVEIRKALPDDMIIDQSVDLASILEPLPYLNGVMHETLRLYPTVPITMRQAIRDSNLAGQPIPRGVVVVLSMWQMNRSPEVWGSSAGEFKPERWITGGKPNSNGGASSNYEFLTFLHGPRSCIGQGFAKAELRCLLASMIRTFSWELAMDEAKVMPRGVITIKPAHGLYVNLRPLGT